MNSRFGRSTIPWVTATELPAEPVRAPCTDAIVSSLNDAQNFR